MPYLDKFNKSEENINQLKTSIKELNNEMVNKNSSINQLKQKIEDTETQFENYKKKSMQDNENKKSEIKNIKEELTKLNCEKGMITVNLKSKDDSLKKSTDDNSKLKDQILTLKTKIEVESKSFNEQISLLNAKDNTNININTNTPINTSNPKTNQYNKPDSMFNPKPDSMFNQNANMPPSMFLNNNNDSSSQMSKEMSELDKQIKAKNAMQNKLQSNSKGFDLPASLRMGSSYTDKFKQRNINKTE